jgi:DNA-binding CsgD family transcriptional regulator/PAS domain-containing protein
MLTSYNGKDLVGVVSAVYDSIADERLWDDTLDQIRLVCDGHLAMLGVLDTETNSTRFSVESGDRKALAPITGIHASNYSFLPAVPKLELDQPYQMSSIYAVQGPEAREQWINSRLNQEWVIPNRIDDCIWLPMVKTQKRIGHLVVITNMDRGPVTKEDLAMMGQLAPHVRRAVTIGDLFEAERGRGEIFGEVIDALFTPVIIVSAEMQVLFANKSAEDMLREMQVVSSRMGRLEFSYRMASNAITHAVETSTRDEFIMGPCGINIPLLRAEIPAVAHVMPLMRREPPHRVSHKAAAAIFFATSGNAPIAAMDAIGALFGLTAAEKNVAAQVALGRNAMDIASGSGLSENTVKTQIRNVFEKTGVGDQKNLAILIKDLSPPIRD